MNSKKVPMWLVFENAEEFGDPVTIIFKVPRRLFSLFVCVLFLLLCFWFFVAFFGEGGGGF